MPLPSYDDPIAAGPLGRLRAVGLPLDVLTWRHLASQIYSMSAEGLLRVLRVTRDVKAFRGAFEALIVPLLCSKTTPGKPVDCQAVLPPPLGQRLAAQGVPSLAQVISWTEVVAFLKVGQVPEVNAATVAGPGPASMEWQQLTMLYWAVTNETADRPNPMLNGCVALGVELQDLGSAAVQCLDPKLTIQLAEHATLLKTRGCGTDGDWKLITDGANLEYVLSQTMLLGDLVTTFAEIDTVHTRLRKLPPGVYQIGDEVIVLCENGKTGTSMVTNDIQPQFNFELPLDMLCDFVESLTATHAVFQQCFGASGYFWAPSRTNREIEDCRRLATKVKALAIGPLLGPNADADAIRQVRGLMLLFGMCGIHAAAYAKPDEPPKDMPILCKTDPVRLTHELVLADVLAKPAAGKSAGHALFNALNPLLTSAGRNAMQGIRALFIAGTHPVHCHVDVTPAPCVGSPRWGSGQSRRQVLLEMRRAPVGPVAACLTASHAILEHFVVDVRHLYS